jgi:hypothetical protein
MPTSETGGETRPELRDAHPERLTAVRLATKPVANRTIALEALAASALAVGAAAGLAPGDVGLTSIYPYPVWLAVAVLAARYGARGVAFGAVLGWGIAAAAAAVMRVPLDAVLARSTAGPDLGALLAVVMIGWVASFHERRAADLGASLEALERRCAGESEALAALRSTAVVLRARADRLETSLTFLRDVASRLESGDRAAAAQAALDLALARTGARAGWVVEVGGAGLEAVASSGPWATAPDFDADRTVASALRNRRPTRAVDLSEASANDSDLVAPIIDQQGAHLLGLVLLRGVPQGGASSAALHDLALIADWSSRSLAARRSTPAADNVERRVAALSVLGPDGASAGAGEPPRATRPMARIIP